MAKLTRDPISELFDAGAVSLLERAYATPGRPVRTRLANPSPQQARNAAQIWDIDVLGPDDAPSGTARTRWARAFMRALYYQHRNYYRRGDHLGAQRRTSPSPRPLVVKIGRAVPALGVIPAGRMVEVTLMPGGKAKAAAVAALPESRRYTTDDKQPAGAWNGGGATREWEDMTAPE